MGGDVGSKSLKLVRKERRRRFGGSFCSAHEGKWFRTIVYILPHNTGD